MAKKRTYQDDDGRTIADMSGIEPSPVLFPRLPRKEKRSQAPQGAGDRPWEGQEQFTEEQRRAAMGGALKAAHRRGGYRRRGCGHSRDAVHLEPLKPALLRSAP